MTAEITIYEEAWFSEVLTFYRSLPILPCAKWSLCGEHFVYINHWSTLECWDSNSAMSIYFRFISSVFATSTNIQ